MSRTVAVNALTQGMFKRAKNRNQKAEKIAKELTNVDTHKEHARHIHSEDLEEMGLKIKHLEKDHDLQDAVLSVHHAFVITLANTPAAKIIENHEGCAMVKNV